MRHYASWTRRILWHEIWRVFVSMVGCENGKKVTVKIIFILGKGFWCFGRLVVEAVKE